LFSYSRATPSPQTTRFLFSRNTVLITFFSTCSALGHGYLTMAQSGYSNPLKKFK
jgi:hypothetical protein